LRESLAGNLGHFWEAGSVIEWDADDVARMIERGMVELCPAPKEATPPRCYVPSDRR
jgi:hypothetical protein